MESQIVLHLIPNFEMISLIYIPPRLCYLWSQIYDGRVVYTFNTYIFFIVIILEDTTQVNLLKIYKWLLR